MTIYTIGYLNTTRLNLKHKIQELNLVLVDIRLNPYSHFPFWNKNDLEDFFKEDYLHIKDLGNENYKGREIKIPNIDNGIKAIKEIYNRNKSCILMCVCSKYNLCHRKIIAEKVKEILCCEIEEIE
jgi:uncharacterized protein (DUF488 family)